ncbi:MAG: hypothetical protein ABS53_05760 [Hydrogenophaga sp. SCN 70-13]|uniref:hypothetical protein n=1 Tax=unclassified Hydrogenophaga TaxID=2610897 RepID=UPI00086DD301|nr:MULTISPECIES: hypothetical protein [unclassified Hydrogenophaga]MBN9373144.1 hypothetical protein [Hydrogenophaga sp.]ODT33192.1 MAG: hypothetical protein ABS53_05760 [Hydrogenophaga sp. SCN 70-13]OJV70399.1 MAG: hypothetical protein BGO22_14880 [Hydrogenophaga sp. 70-12]
MRSSISTHFQRLGIELNTTFNKGGQYEQAHRQLMAWGHDAREATAIAKTDDYPRLHALVFGTLIGPPPFAPRTPTLNESDTQALLAVCQAWLEAGNPMAASRLVCAVFKDRPQDAALLHQLLCRAPKVPQTLMAGFEPDATQHLVPAILCLAERGWTNRADPSVHLNAASRDALDKLVQRADPTQWMRLCLITARQRVQAGQPLMPPVAPAPPRPNPPLTADETDTDLRWQEDTQSGPPRGQNPLPVALADPDHRAVQL